MLKRLSILVCGVAFVLCLFFVRGLRKQQNSSAPESKRSTPDIQSAKPSESAGRTQDHPNPSASRPAEMDAKALFDRLFNGYKMAMARGGHPPTTRFASEAYFKLREARLLALVEPDQVINFAFATASDPSRSVLERLFGVRLLRFLLEEGSKKAESQLLLIAHDREREVSMGALYALAAQDNAGTHRALYQQKCSEGWEEAFDLLSFWPDSSLRGWVTKLESASDKNLEFIASELKERLEVIHSSASATRIQGLISRVDGDVERWTLWAIKAAKVSSVPGLREALRSRLDWAFRNASERHEAVRALLQPDPDKPSFEENYTKARGVASFPDPVHDEVLLEFARSGGQLTELEKQRCRYFGYFCDPKERLAELLAEGR